MPPLQTLDFPSDIVQPCLRRSLSFNPLLLQFLEVFFLAGDGVPISDDFLLPPKTSFRSCLVLSILLLQGLAPVGKVSHYVVADPSHNPKVAFWYGLSHRALSCGVRGRLHAPTIQRMVHRAALLSKRHSCHLCSKRRESVLKVGRWKLVFLAEPSV